MYGITCNRMNGMKHTVDDVRMIYRYINMNNRDKTMIYLTDIKLMMTPLQASPSDAGSMYDSIYRGVVDIDGRICDAFCTILDREIYLMNTINDICMNMSIHDVDSIWNSDVQSRYVHYEE